jgi:DNA-binding MarR family transcriptional regulator
MADQDFPYQLGPSFVQEFPGADARATECIINVVIAAQLVEAVVEPFLRAQRLSMGAVNVLEILRGAGAPLPPSVIGERLLITRATVTALVDTLERRGLVRRRPHPHDRRMLLIQLTAAGQAALWELMPRLHLAERDWAGDLDTEEKPELLRLLGKLQRRLAAERQSHKATPGMGET